MGDSDYKPVNESLKKLDEIPDKIAKMYYRFVGSVFFVAAVFVAGMFAGYDTGKNENRPMIYGLEGDLDIDNDGQTGDLVIDGKDRKIIFLKEIMFMN